MTRWSCNYCPASFNNRPAATIHYDKVHGAEADKLDRIIMLLEQLCAELSSEKELDERSI